MRGKMETTKLTNRARAGMGILRKSKGKFDKILFRPAECDGEAILNVTPLLKKKPCDVIIDDKLKQEIKVLLSIPRRIQFTAVSHAADKCIPNLLFSNWSHNKPSDKQRYRIVNYHQHFAAKKSLLSYFPITGYVFVYFSNFMELVTPYNSCIRLLLGKREPKIDQFRKSSINYVTIIL